MVLVLLGTAAAGLVMLVGAWGTRRRLASAAWDRELEAAFAVAERREMPTRRVL
jgi:hypothetical protein